MNVVKPEPNPPLAEAKAAPPRAVHTRPAVLRAGDSIAQFASAYPTISVISAFAIGFALARLVRRLNDT